VSAGGAGARDSIEIVLQLRMRICMHVRAPELQLLIMIRTI
jgi:hypothetical protein